MAAILVAFTTLGVMACGAGNSETAEKAVKEETAADVAESGSAVSAEVEETSEKAEEEETASKDSKTEAAEEEKETKVKNPITWYMDEEGVKSDILGMNINKENTVLGEIQLFENLGVRFGNRTEQHVFNCDYYEGDMESYLAENDHMTKDKIGEIEYAYGESWGSWDVVFIGNGVKISTYIFGDDLEGNQSVGDFLSSMNVVTKYDEFQKDCLAYITVDGLYCPALGLSFSCEGSKNVVNNIGVKCSNADFSAYMTIGDESTNGMGIMYYMADANTAQEVVDKYVEGAIEPSEYKTVEQAEIEGTVEVNLGNYKFLGRGVTTKNDFINNEDWLFYSDDATWSVSVSYEAGNHYENYLSVIEKLN